MPFRRVLIKCNILIRNVNPTYKPCNCLTQTYKYVVVFTYSINYFYTGADPGFQVRGGALKKMRRAEGGAKNFEVFRVKKHDFTPKNHIFSNGGGWREHFSGISCGKSQFYTEKSYFFQWRREARKFLGYFVWKITILRQKNHIFSNFRGGAPPLNPPLDYLNLEMFKIFYLLGVY